MKFRLIEEPSLAFGTNQHICPRAGINHYHPFDITHVRPERIVIGVIGKNDGIEKTCNWLDRCKNEIPGKKPGKSKKINTTLFPPFCGFNKSTGFLCEVVYDNTYLRELNNSDFDQIIKQFSNLSDRIVAAAQLYLNEIKYLAKNKNPDVILCVISENFIEHITEAVIEKELPEEIKDERESEEEDDEKSELEENFRRYLKAKAMQFQVPIQIVRDRIANPTAEMQDEATIAWNFFTALYYKASGTPWALIRKDMSETTCYAGISFYKSRDKKTTQTSIAQIFNEVGKGVILRGEEIQKDKKDNSPHLTGEQAYKLLYESLKEYHEAIRQMPKRLVLHKTSNFNDAEIEGFKSAAKEFHIYQVDLISILSSDIRLYREHQYPPLRGTHLALTDRHHVLYTRGSVPYYETYTGMYIPRAIEVRLFEYDESPDRICDEILALTKMNWNNTQFDRRMPITIECARNVGDILKYVDSNEKMQLKYSFYM